MFSYLILKQTREKAAEWVMIETHVSEGKLKENLKKICYQKRLRVAFTGIVVYKYLNHLKSYSSSEIKINTHDL